MRKFKSEKRLNKIISAASARQFSLRVVLENIFDSHNVSAILRTCDAVGVPKVNLLYNIESFPKLSRISSASASKWIEIEKFSDTKSCIDSLKSEGFKVYTSCLDNSAKNIFDLDLTERIALSFGNEHRGVSDELKNLSDEIFYIPMKGMIQSLNVSVAVAVSLYETQRQRTKKGFYNNPQLKNDELEKLIDDWCGR
jgi:tRNA (guanosine-2'-O-)-methyltransferase